LLVVQDHEASVAFHAVALGPERTLQAAAAEYPEIGVQLYQVAVRYDVIWEMAEVIAIVHAITGLDPKAEHFLRPELLCHA